MKYESLTGFESIYRVIGIDFGTVQQNALRLVQFRDSAREPYRLVVLLYSSYDTKDQLVLTDANFVSIISYFDIQIKCKCHF